MLVRFLLAAALLCSPGAATAKPRMAVDARTPLDKYCAQPDPAFAWEVVHRVETPTHRTLIVLLTSQRWRTASEVSRTEWRHWLSIVVPNEAESDTALLFITGGSNEEAPPVEAEGRIVGAALATRSVVAELRTVPNQPLKLLTSDQPDRPRSEDDLLAASWVEFMETDDPTWLAQLPMAKSAVAAMTAVQQAVAAEARSAGRPTPAIARFTVAGASKRGWTTWLTAAVDDRVAAIAPIVIDVLNIEPSMRHHQACYGEYSQALKDYEGQGLADRLSSPAGAAIRAIVDPYAYRDRLSLPKCVINASGDEFFLPDSSRFYFDDLPGEKLLACTPNTGHSLAGTDALDTLAAFHASVAHNLPRPTVTWQSAFDAPVHTVRCSFPPTEAVLWRAVNPSGRDFRKPVVGDAFKATPLEPDADGAYRVPIEAPPEGFSAAFARFTFDIGAGVPLRVSTPVWVAPDVEPFAKQP
ncbi:PhoPQ-activated pathogenicity-related protein [Pirellulimonas nuda]|uniref:PhoPQ-activated pathogenicity-related protein n=1 Tax=Pirellulimonas nuda TaxID=2528009 RepID=A0A518DI13_9BACT|nr:PhoPQ-activated protein PqaA family protein [Pirellulimonas nuda]QDU91032.1 PhoPQ-activated pathogenicity-related protein [Pirellulimonas nuda]